MYLFTYLLIYLSICLFIYFNVLNWLIDVSFIYLLVNYLFIFIYSFIYLVID